ncbi:MAG: hypothetical protein NVSMB3_10060 [Acidobacteriaceae bacterium]
MRKNVFYLLAGLLACGVPGLLAQTAPPAESARVEQSERAAVDAPVIAPQSFSAAMSFLQQSPTQQPVQNPTSAPVPQRQETPVVAPAQTTPQSPIGAYAAYGNPDAPPADHLGSTYIPVDSWVYPAMTRLYSLGYVDTMFLGMRPWTRRSVLHMLQGSENDIQQDGNREAEGILNDVLEELRAEAPGGDGKRGAVFGLYSGYTRLMGIGGPVLRDSFHLGQAIHNDYGRPYATGFNNITGFSSVNELGRFSLHVRGEYQHSPATTGYPVEVASNISAFDAIPYSGFNVPQDTIPEGKLAAQNPFRLVEATLSFHVLGHEISGGKSDAWLGPAQGGALAWSNNAENIYSFRINRVEPLKVPLVSRVLGPLRYDFFYGSLKGHTSPNHPYTHSEMFSFRPTDNFEFGFQRTIVFGGAGHEPVNLHTFLKGFFSVSDTTADVKVSREDPGARFSDFNFSYRLPFVRKYATFYTDSIVHDDVTPVSAPRRASFRTGLYLSQIPNVPKLDFRVEAIMMDPKTSRSVYGSFNYYEIIQKQGYTNKGYIMGDWAGREAKGGQAWLTYHLSGREWVQVEYLNKKNAKDFVGGTTQNEFKVEVVKRLQPQLELDAWAQYERWKAPIYKAGAQSDTIVAGQLTWYPRLHTPGQN